MTSRVWLIGESNPYGSDPSFALYPLPERASGGRLAAILGLSADEYLRAFVRRNLIDGPKWSAPAARVSARQMIVAAGDGAALVLLGARVASAFGVPFIPLATSIYLRPVNIRLLVIPHPSGLNRAWHNPTTAPRVRAAVLALLPQVTSAPKCPTCRAQLTPCKIPEGHPTPPHGATYPFTAADCHGCGRRWGFCVCPVCTSSSLAHRGVST